MGLRAHERVESFPMLYLRTVLAWLSSTVLALYLLDDVVRLVYPLPFKREYIEKVSRTLHLSSTRYETVSFWQII